MTAVMLEAAPKGIAINSRFLTKRFGENPSDPDKGDQQVIWPNNVSSMQQSDQKNSQEYSKQEKKSCSI